MKWPATGKIQRKGTHALIAPNSASPKLATTQAGYCKLRAAAARRTKNHASVSQYVHFLSELCEQRPNKEKAQLEAEHGCYSSNQAQHTAMQARREGNKHLLARTRSHDPNSIVTANEKLEARPQFNSVQAQDRAKQCKAHMSQCFKFLQRHPGAKALRAPGLENSDSSEKRRARNKATKQQSN